MKLKTLFYFTLISSLFLISCGEETAFADNPFYDEEATGDKPNLPPSGNGNGSGNGGVISNQSMSFTADGEAISFAICQVDTVNNSFDVYDLEGSDQVTSAIDPYKYLSFTVAAFDTTDFIPEVGVTYELSDTSLISGFYSTDFISLEDSVTFYATSGQLNFSVVGPNTHEGSFSMTVENSAGKQIVISGGTFTAEFK